MKKSNIIAVLIGIVGLGVPMTMSAADNYESRIFTSDNGDGTFSNPVIYSDFPDPDVIRVDNTFYLLSTSMFYMPGGTILRSYDLVNWEYCANPIDFIENDEAYNLQNGKNRYSHGMWASSLQYNPANNKFYLLYNTLDDGAYLMTASDIEGPWTKKKLNHSFYDCGVMFDTDGKIYVVRGNGQIWIDEVDDNFKVLKSHKVADSPSGFTIEGSRLYHIGDYYYVYSTYCNWPGKQTVFRSNEIFGEYTEKILLDDGGVHQGALVDLPNGDWWTILFKDMWPWGRLPYLLPVKFKDGWPVIGNNGKAMTKCNKPDITSLMPTPIMETNDGFRSVTLGKQWQWNHNPLNSRWSLTERPGYLRLKTATVTDDIFKARNTLTQHMFGYRRDLAHSYGTFCIDISKMKEGDQCGITTMQDPHAYLCVKMNDGQKEVFMGKTSLTGKIENSTSKPIKFESDIVYLRGIASFDGSGTINYYYSIDAENWKKVGTTYTMQYDLTVFVGNRWGIFNFATKSSGGYIDIDWFSTDPNFDEDAFYGNTFDGYYDDDELTIDYLEPSVEEFIMLPGTNATFDVFAVYKDGRRENVTTSASYKSSNYEVVETTKGTITGKKDGAATITITVTDLKGNKIRQNVNVKVTTFPLTADLFNTSIWDQATFDPSTGKVTPAQYGFVGWKYQNSVNLSGYKYAVAKVTGGSGLSFRMFDTDNYWSDPAIADANGKEYMMFKLNSMKNNSGNKVNPSHIYIAGFWSAGTTPFYINDVYVTNDDDYLNPSDKVDIILSDENRVEGIYNIHGIKVDDIDSAPAGIYIINGRKVLISK